MAQQECPLEITLAMPRANAACAGLQRNQACYGNGSVMADFQPEQEILSFHLAGNKVPVWTLRSLHLSNDTPNELDVAVLNIQANLPETETGRFVTILLFGNADLVDLVPPLPRVEVTTTGTLNVRALPDIGADIIETLELRETMLANGRTEEGWLRVRLPDTAEIGWISADSIRAAHDLNLLDVVDVSTLILQPFQVMNIATGADDAPCTGAPNSGALIQTPNDFSEVELVINGARMHLAATVFIQAQSEGSMTVNVLDGRAEIATNGAVQVIPAGAKASVSLNDQLQIVGVVSAVVPYDAFDLVGLPINNLPYRFALPLPLSDEEIAAFLKADSAPEATPVLLQTPTLPPRCRRVTRRDVNLTAGPGTFYEVISHLPRNSVVAPVYELEDTDGVLWWQLRNNAWLPVSQVDESGECEPVPVITVFDPPAYNHLSIEDCFTTNGPVREGQQVEIEFIDGGWETYEDAQQAPRIDPGSITVDGIALRYVTASSPFEVSGKYFRYFRANWTATPGAHRIVGERLTYNVSCNLSVPVGN